MLSRFFRNSHNFSNLVELSYLSWIVRDLIHIEKEREKFVVEILLLNENEEMIVAVNVLLLLSL